MKLFMVDVVTGISVILLFEPNKLPWWHFVLLGCLISIATTISHNIGRNEGRFR